MNKRRLLAFAIAVLLPAGAAQADSIDYRGTGLGIWGIQVNYTGSSAFQYGPGGFAGQIRLANLTTGSGEFFAYCLDASQTLSDPQTMIVRNLTELPDAGNPPRATLDSGARVAWLLNTYQGNGLITSADMAAGLQLAVWEVLYETASSWSVSAGNGIFSLTNASSYAGAAAAADSMLTALGTNTSDAMWLDWQSTGSTTVQHGQDFGVAVPEPGSILLLGVGLIGAGLAFRRRRR